MENVVDVKIAEAMEMRVGEKVPNCTETLMMIYSDELGLTKEQAKALGTNFGLGLKSGSVCGVVTGAIMVLGGLGVNDPVIVKELQQRIGDNHDGMINCADLLKANALLGRERRPHCNEMIVEAIRLIEEYRN